MVVGVEGSATEDGRGDGDGDTAHVVGAAAPSTTAHSAATTGRCLRYDNVPLLWDSRNLSTKNRPSADSRGARIGLLSRVVPRKAGGNAMDEVASCTQRRATARSSTTAAIPLMSRGGAGGDSAAPPPWEFRCLVYRTRRNWPPRRGVGPCFAGSSAVSLVSSTQEHGQARSDLAVVSQLGRTLHGFARQSPVR